MLANKQFNHYNQTEFNITIIEQRRIVHEKHENQK